MTSSDLGLELTSFTLSSKIDAGGFPSTLGGSWLGEKLSGAWFSTTLGCCGSEATTLPGCGLEATTLGCCELEATLDLARAALAPFLASLLHLEVEAVFKMNIFNIL